MKNITRREAVGAIGIASGSILLSSFFRNEIYGYSGKKKSVLPWAYTKLDPLVTADRAYQGFYVERCMYGVFESIIGQLGEKFGEPYSLFPFEMMRYGEGGVAGWSSLCGALNGAAAAIKLVSKNYITQVNELFTWYEQILLPTYVPKKPRLAFDMPTSISGSVICHTSVTLWTKASGNKYRNDSKERDERCARVTASVAEYTAKLLNAEYDGKFIAAFKTKPEVKRCQGCHTAKTEEALCNSRGKMDCITCHQDIIKVGPDHP